MSLLWKPVYACSSTAPDSRFSGFEVKRGHYGIPVNVMFRVRNRN